MGTHMRSASQRDVTSTKVIAGLAAAQTSKDSRMMEWMRAHVEKFCHFWVMKKLTAEFSEISGCNVAQKSGASAQRMSGRR